MVKHIVNITFLMSLTHVRYYLEFIASPLITNYSDPISQYFTMLGRVVIKHTNTHDCLNTLLTHNYPFVANDH